MTAKDTETLAKSAREHSTALQTFLENGKIPHSDDTKTINAIIAHCEKHRTPYRLKASPGIGYQIEKLYEFEASELDTTR